MRVLILAAWPITRPMHGGQLRGAAIVEAYRDAGHTVEFVGLYDPRDAEPGTYTAADHPITPAIVNFDPGYEGTPEMRFWHGLATEPGSQARLREHVAQFRPDLIQFEEPFLWPVVRHLLQCGALEANATNPGGRRVAIVHASHNVEHAWRRHGSEGRNAALIAEIEALEREIARRADAICVVSPSDQAAFRSMGADCVVLASSGSALPSPAPAARRIVRQYLGGQRFALFVSSAHPPNAGGLVEMIEQAPRAVLRNGVVVVCGEVARLLRPYAARPSLEHLFRSIRLLGRVTKELLPALYAEAHAAIVPRTTGGGSNLKVAEALLAGCSIVATTRAFDGYEAFMAAPGVHLADDPARFWEATDAALGGPAPPPRIARDGMNALDWKASLAPMVRLAETLRPDASAIRRSWP